MAAPWLGDMATVLASWQVIQVVCGLDCLLNGQSNSGVTAGKCNWRHSGWSARLVGFPQCYLTCRFLTNKIFYLIQVWVAFQN